MSFIGDLFGGGPQQQPQYAVPDAPVAPTPQAVAPTPVLSDAASISASQEESTRLNKRYGQSSTILTSGLGDSSSGGDSDIARTNALGGNSSLTPTT